MKPHLSDKSKQLGCWRVFAICAFGLAVVIPSIRLYADDSQLQFQAESTGWPSPDGLSPISHETPAVEEKFPFVAAAVDDPHGGNLPGVLGGTLPGVPSTQYSAPGTPYSVPGTQYSDSVPGGHLPGIPGESYLPELVPEGEFYNSSFNSDYNSNSDYDSIPFAGISLKIGGYAKFDFIQDFDPIGSTDLFDTTTIPTSGPHRGNTRLHARQTRLNLDVTRPSELGDVQVFVEGDFFGAGPGTSFRLRHGYGKLGPMLAGQTWSTFMDEMILPDVVDFESPTGALLSRRAMFRWTQPLPVTEGFLFEYSLAVEDPGPAFTSTDGTFENALPDFIGRLHLQSDIAHARLATFVTQAHFDPTVGPDSDATAWGVNLSGSVQLTEASKWMGQFAYGHGIERFRGFPSYSLDANGSLVTVPLMPWYVGYEYEWSDQWKSVIAYSRATVEHPTATPALLRSTDYIAANLLWRPIEQVRLGLEYLHGIRVDQDSSRGDANRLQFAVWYYLP